MSHLLSDLFSDPDSSNSLKTLAFLNCGVGEGFLRELTQFASNRKRTASAWLYDVFIVNPRGVPPHLDLIFELEKHVKHMSVVDVRVGSLLGSNRRKLCGS